MRIAHGIYRLLARLAPRASGRGGNCAHSAFVQSKDTRPTEACVQSNSISNKFCASIPLIRGIHARGSAGSRVIAAYAPPIVRTILGRPAKRTGHRLPNRETRGLALLMAGARSRGTSPLTPGGADEEIGPPEMRLETRCSRFLGPCAKRLGPYSPLVRHREIPS